LLDLILRDNLTHSESSGNHSINKGDKIVFASVGAGMNINALVYIV